MRIVALIALSAPQAACTIEAAPQCFATRQTQTLNAFEEGVLADAIARTMEECNAEKRQCQRHLKREPDGSLVVFVSYATVIDDGGCGYLPGDDEMHVYDARGVFVERVPGM